MIGVGNLFSNPMLKSNHILAKSGSKPAVFAPTKSRCLPRPESAKAAEIREADDSADDLERLLDSIHGHDRGAQVPGHFGNGIFAKDPVTQKDLYSLNPMLKRNQILAKPQTQKGA